MKTKIILFLMLFSGTLLISAQEITVTGTVNSAEDNFPLPGISVLVKGTSRGTSTDFDGKYSIAASAGEVLEFSSIGLKTQTVTVGTESVINVTMQEDTESLDEVVVIGYGTQRKVDLVGAIATVDSETIQQTPNANVMQSLQGRVPGVQIVSNGAPGVEPTVRLRGVNSFNAGGNPLYVVDGQWYNTIDFLDPNQIESISVLKDVSSVAIFGQRGVNGVIIVETKKGRKEQTPSVTYNGYTGVQFAQNVVKMANTEQFATMAFESGSAADIQFIENAIARFGRSRVNPNLPDVNTDWYDEVLREATITSHSIGVTGGSERTTYVLNTSYFAQDGILDMKNEYERFNIQGNFNVDVSDRFRIGVNSIFSNATRFAPENGAWFQAYFAVPTLPVFDFTNEQATTTPYSDATFLGYRSAQNPRPVMEYINNRIRARKILTSIFAEYDIIPEKLVFKTSYFHDFSVISERRVELPYFISNNSNRLQSETAIRRAENIFSNQIWDNTLTYSDTFGKHNVKVLAGTSFRDEAVNNFNARGEDVTGINFESSWFLDFADQASFVDNVEGNGDRLYSFSYFNRFEYSYDDKYLLNVTLRAEGDGRFPREIWKTTPQFGAGWIISNENFMQDNDIVDFLKLRGSWGKLANGALGGSAGQRTVNADGIIAIGNNPVSIITVTNNFTDLVREVLTETNVGVTARMFNNNLSLEADYYIRDTDKLVLPVPQPIVGNNLLENVGAMRNQGLEVALNWSQMVSDDLGFNIGGNFATLKNEMTQIDNGLGYVDTGGAQFRQRSIIGEPVEAFFGWEVAGVYQNQEDITSDPIAVANNLEPGDFKFIDSNGDGEITDADRTVIGSYLPTLTYGGNLGIKYKHFALNVVFSGVSGNQILNRKRGEVVFTNDTNIDADYAINRWTGEGSTNSYPSSAGRRKGWNQRMSTFFVEDGDYFRIQNIQFSYTIPANSLIGKNMPETRFTLTADRPFTFFNYNGFDPEVPNGIDRQTYPVPTVITAGVNLKF